MVNIYDPAFSKNLLKGIWDKVFKNNPSKICGKQSLKNLKRYGLPKKTIPLQIFCRLSSTNFTQSILEYFVPYNSFCRLTLIL